MKITTKNYFDTVKEIGFENLPLVLKQSHTLITVKTDNGKDWSLYHKDEDLKRMADLAFRKLEEYMDSEGLSGVNGNSIKKEIESYEKLDTKTLYDLLDGSLIIEGKNAREINQKKAAIKNIIDKRDGKTPQKQNSKKINPYSKIATESKFIERFLAFHDKVLYKNTFGIFIDDLQKVIQEKQITKKSPVAKDIIKIQQAAISAFNSMKNAKHFVLSTATIKRLKGIIEKYENTHDDIDECYVKSKKKKISLNGTESAPQVNIMPSKDFTNLQFNTIGFKEKWLDFIGDPALGFTAMVFGMPKMGKSYLCIEFAGYLARNHGKVLYIAKEEKLDKTLQDKLNDKQVAHENLFVADALPSDLSDYDFIFLDSVNKLGLSPSDLNKLKTDNPGKSFIYVFQATKGGQFKGNNEFQHDVDVVIEVPSQGKAVQYGRFNQGGEMNIFEDDPSVEQTEELNGTKKKSAKTKDWTEPEWLNKSDWDSLKHIKRLYEGGRFEEAMNYSRNCDTVIREEIPPNIWLKIGGQLTPTGVEKLKAMSKSQNKKTNNNKPKDIDYSYYGNNPDDNNINFIFRTTATSLLVGMLNGLYDINYCVRAELANRGLDAHGDWVGFDKAKEIHKIK